MQRWQRRLQSFWELPTLLWFASRDKLVGGGPYWMGSVTPFISADAGVLVDCCARAAVLIRTCG